MNRYQQIANDAYGDDSVRRYAEDPLGGHGDGLARFIADELDTENDDFDLEEAASRMRVAANDLARVAEALYSEARKEKRTL